MSDELSPICPEAEYHGNPFRYCPVKGCGWIEPSPKPEQVALDRESVARIIDPQAFERHAMTWVPGPGDFPSNWQNRRDAAYRKADEIAARVAAAKTEHNESCATTDQWRDQRDRADAAEDALERIENLLSAEEDRVAAFNARPEMALSTDFYGHPYRIGTVLGCEHVRSAITGGDLFEKTVLDRRRSAEEYRNRPGSEDE